MSAKTKIMVVRMREVIYTGIFIVLGIVLIILGILMFRPQGTAEKKTPGSNHKYTPGVYTSPITLGDNVLDVEADRINGIRLNSLSETVSTMYPLVEPSIEHLEEQILQKQSTSGITSEESGRYTSQLLLDAIEKALACASGGTALSQ